MGYSRVMPSLAQAFPGYDVCAVRYTHTKNNYTEALSSNEEGMRSRKSDFGNSLLLQAEGTQFPLLLPSEAGRLCRSSPAHAPPVGLHRAPRSDHQLLDA